MSDKLKYSTTWNPKTITNKVFENKFIGVSNIFRDWISPVLDLSQSTILDFGCGEGVMSLGMALRMNPVKVFGVDIVSEFTVLPAMARAQIGLEAMPENVHFQAIKPNAKLADSFRADCIFTWSVFEHIHQDFLDEVVLDLRSVLNDGGYIFLQIAPLYYSAFGGHLFELVPEPWAHLSHQHDKLRHLVLNARKTAVAGQLISPEDDESFKKHKDHTWSCFQTLNKITGDEIIDLFQKHGFELVRQYRTNCAPEPSEKLKRIFSEAVLRNEQIVILLRKR